MDTLQTLWNHLSTSKAGKVAGIGLVLILIVLSAIHPLTYGLMPATPDGLLHLYRLVALDHAIQHGDIWPRYVPGFLFGYGAPVFNYYAPLSLYVPELLHLIGLRFLSALLIAMMLYALLASLGAYLLGRAWGGPVAGIVAAVAYSYVPYLLYDWPRRGAVAEFAALAILPWTLWAFWRLAVRGHRSDLVLAAVTLGALIITHNITALYAMPILTAYSAYLWWISPDPRRAFVRLGLAGLFALGLTAFFWLPALIETRYVHIERVTYGVANLDFHNNFQSLFDTFAFPLTADLTQLHSPVRRTLSWPQLLLTGAAAGIILWPGLLPEEERKRLRGLLALSGGMLIVLLFLTTRASTLIWEVMPLMNFIQFPWRLLGPISLILALWAGIGAALSARFIFPLSTKIVAPLSPAATHKTSPDIKTSQAARGNESRRGGEGKTAVDNLVPKEHTPPTWAVSLWIGLIAAILILYSLPWLYGAYISDPPARTIVDAQNFERQTGWIAGTAAGEYVPIWTTQLPDSERLLGLYAQSEVIPRLQPNADVTLNGTLWRAMGGTLIFNAHKQTTLYFDWLYFPGWWAELDGMLARVEPAGPQGYVSVVVPPGNHTLILGFGPTPLRLGAMIGSALFAALLIATLFFLPKRTWLEAEPDRPRETLPVHWLIFAVAVAAVGVFALQSLWIDDAQTPIKRARFAQGLDAGLETPVQASFNHQITLLGFDITPRRIASGDTVRMALYWQLSGETIKENYSSVIYLRDPEGNVLTQIGSQHPGDLPTSQWVAGLYVQERLALTVPPGTPPGTYLIHAALYSPDAQRNLDAFDAADNSTGVTIQIGSLEVIHPRWPASTDAPSSAVKIDKEFNPALTLAWVGTLPEESEVGQPFSLIWFWRAQGIPGQAYSAQLQWVKAGDQKGTSPAIPLVAGYSADLWQRGDVWKGIHVLHVPGRLDAGDYEIRVQLLDAHQTSVGSPISIGQMRVTTPPRTTELPNNALSTDALWQNQIKLAGYTIGKTRIAAGDALNLTLYWQPQADLNQSLTVFVHIVDESGNIVGQQDQIPARGARPTTGWSPGEVVKDDYQILIKPHAPAGDYAVQVGWYDPLTGQRVLLNDGTDFLILPQPITIR